MVAGRSMRRREVIVAAGAWMVLGSRNQASAATGPPVLALGARGPDVTALQRRLSELGYWCGAADGVFGSSTAHAVVTIQKIAGLARDGVVGVATRAALDRGVRPTSRRGGRRIEVDKARQVLLVVRDGAAVWAFSTSTGNGEPFTWQGRQVRAVTPSGDFTVFRRGVDGWEKSPLGRLWRPYYFTGGIAIHGAYEVPAYAASHGCCRLPIAAQDFLVGAGLLRVGSAVSCA